MQLPEKENSSDFDLIFLFAGELTKHLTAKSAAEFADEIRAVLSQNCDFKQTFTFDEIQYGFHTDLSNMSMAEYLDIQALEEDGQFWSNIHKILTILYRPIIEFQSGDYNIKPYTKPDYVLADRWKNELSGDIAVGAVAFFLNLRLGLLIDSPAYLKNQS